MTPMAAAAHNCGSWLTQAKAGAQAGWNMTDPGKVCGASRGGVGFVALLLIAAVVLTAVALVRRTRKG